jgi:hypothetical protein
VPVCSPQNEAIEHVVLIESRRQRHRKRQRQNAPLDLSGARRTWMTEVSICMGPLRA